jgi:signal transduction histidine kinase/ligand-binding sensor domain-containing protein
VTAAKGGALGRIFNHTDRRGRWFRCIGLCAVAVLATTWPASALDPGQPAADYLRRTFTTEDGLHSNVVNGVLQTQDGFLIVGSWRGLFRFDGHRFAEMNSDPPKAMAVYSLAEGPDGDLWVATRFGAYRVPHSEIGQRWQTLSVYHMGQGAADPVMCLRFTRAGVLWAGTPSGLFYFAKDHFQQAAAGNVQQIEEARNGHLLISTTHGFFEWDGSRVIEHPEIPTALGIRAEDVFHVLEDRSGVTWYCTAKGIFRRSGGSVKHFLPDPTGDKHGALRAYEDAAGNIWFQTTAAGLLRASSDSLDSVAPEINVRTVTADRDGNLWVGTNGDGLIRFKNRTVRTFTKADGLPNNVVMTVLAATDGKLWAGNNCGGLSWFDGRRFHTYDEKDGLTNSCVNALAEDSKHDLWVGTSGGGLFRFHAGHFQAFTRTGGLGSDTVTCILVARNESLWIGTTGGLTRLRDGVSRNYTTADGLSNMGIANVFQDSSGVIWVATHSGIDRLDGDKFVAAFRPQEHRGVRVAGESPLGDLYVVVEGLGVGRLKDGKLMGIADLNGTQIQVVQQDLWIAGGSGGVIRVGAASLRSWEGEQQDPIDYTNFGLADGFLSKECTGGYPNMTTTKNGKLWVATLGGAAMLDLSRLPPAGGKPFEYISEVEVDRKKRNAGRELILPPGLHHTELQLGSIELSSPERVYMQYRLEGIDSEWLDVKPDGTAAYTTIPHGSYLFRVRASNGDGFWDRQGIVYRITQEPFFYQTAAFQILVIAAGCILLASAYRFRLRQESARIKVGLEGRVAERERIARDLHDTLLQSFQGSLFEVQAARNLFPRRPDDAMQTLDEAIRSAEAAIAEGRDAIQDLRSGSAAPSDLAHLLAAAGQELSGVAVSNGGSPAFCVTVEGPPRDINTILQDELYRIGREILRNAFHHARAKKIEVEIRYDAQELRIRFRDDGVGIDPKVLSEGARGGHWGLPGVRERAKLAGAQLDFWSELGAGTEIQVTVPASVAYAKSSEARVIGLFRKKSRSHGE